MNPIKNPFLRLKGEWTFLWKALYPTLLLTVIFLVIGLAEVGGGSTLNLVGSAAAFGIALAGLLLLGYLLVVA